MIVRIYGVGGGLLFFILPGIPRYKDSELIRSLLLSGCGYTTLEKLEISNEALGH